jgi:hypothetical protein
MNIDATATDPEIKVLKAKRRDELPTDEFITEYDGVDDNGHKYREQEVRGPADTSTTIKSDQTAMYQPAPSTTGDVGMLVMEAELLADGVDLENPHIPADEETLEQARQRIETNDLTPAWEHRL